MKTNQNKIKDIFWDKERCEYCKGKIRAKEVELLRKKKGTYVIFQHVPAGVCQECGTRYLSANTLKIVSQRLKEKKSRIQKTQVSIADLAVAS